MNSNEPAANILASGLASHHWPFNHKRLHFYISPFQTINRSNNYRLMLWLKFWMCSLICIDAACYTCTMRTWSSVTIHLWNIQLCKWTLSELLSESYMFASKTFDRLSINKDNMFQETDQSIIVSPCNYLPQWIPSEKRPSVFLVCCYSCHSNGHRWTHCSGEDYTKLLCERFSFCSGKWSLINAKRVVEFGLWFW